MVLSKRDSLTAYDIALFEYNNFEFSTEEGDPNHQQLNENAKEPK